MEFSSSDPYAGTRDSIGDAVSAEIPIQAMSGVRGSTGDDPGQDQCQNTARGCEILVVMVNDRIISYPSSDVKCILGPPDAVLWVNPVLSASGARPMAAYKATAVPMASNPHPGQNVANGRTNLERIALVSVPNSAIDDVDIEHFGGPVENEWSSQSRHPTSGLSNLDKSPSPLQDRKENTSRSSVTSPVDESSSWNSLGPHKMVRPLFTDQYPNVERYYSQYRNNPFSRANTQISNVPAIHINQASDTALPHANTSNPPTLHGSTGPRGPGAATVRRSTVAQALHPSSGPMQANLGSQQGSFPTWHEMYYLEPSYDAVPWPEAPTPEGTIGSSAAIPYQEPAMPDKQQVTAGATYAPRQLHPGTVRLEFTQKGKARRSLKAPRSRAQKAMKPGKPRGRRTKPLTAAQKNHANTVRSAGPKDCECSRRKVKCEHVTIAKSPQSPIAQGSDPFLGATNAQTETAIHGEPDTPSSQNTSWFTETNALSPFSPSRNQSFGNRNQSFGNTADLDMSRMNLLTKDYQPPAIDVDDAEGDTDDDEMLQMGNTPTRPH